MNASEMSAEMIRHLALRCADTGAIKLRKPTGKVLADSGDFFAWPARSEPLRDYWRAAKVQADILRTTIEDERRRSSAFIRGLGADARGGLTAWIDGVLWAVVEVERAVCELEPDGRRTRPVRAAILELRRKIGRY